MIILAVGLLLPVVLLFCILIRKLVTYFIRKRDFFIKIGRELDERNIIVPTSATKIDKRSPNNDISPKPNYIEIIHDNDGLGYIMLENIK